MSSNLQHGQRPVREITGRPGQSWGYIVIPARGKVTMKISGDLLETKISTAYGLERREISTRIQRIETVEVIEGRLWWLLWLGIFFLFTFFIGVIPIVLFFVLKQKWIVVHNASGNLVLFYKDSTTTREFCRNLMMVSRQLNSKAPAPNANNRNKQKQVRNNSGRRQPTDKSPAYS